MGLKDHLPVIDDRRFDDLVAEARSRIPRYTPEWTDFNESDPGMALVQLFAWMSELLMYRMAKVPQLNYLKFLELVGLELTPARPATVQLTFPVQKKYAESTVEVPLRTQVSTETPDAKGPIIFETERALIALTAALDAVLVFEAPGFRDVTASNDEAEAGFQTFGPRAVAGSALMLGFNSELEFPEVELDLTFWVESGASGAVTCGARASTTLAGAIVWEHWNGRSWRALDLIEDETQAFTRSGHVRMLAPDSDEMERGTFGSKTDVPRFWIRARLEKSGYQSPPRLLAVRTNTVPATEAQTIELEILGGSDGRSDQVFTTTGKPILEGSLTLEVDEGDGFVAWSEVEDLYGSGRDDTHYVLNRTTGEVIFGDGAHGRIPVANAAHPANIRARRYRIGGGQRGNVEASKLNTTLSSVEGIDAAKVANLFASAGGADEESLEDAKDRAPATLKSRDRAVAPEDFELLATRSGNIARAKALPLHHPDFPDVEVPGVVSVVVVPDVTGSAPSPTPATLQAVCAYLDCRRLLTTEVYVLPPRYRTVRVSAELVVGDEADLATVKRLTLASITRYFHALEGGEDSSETEVGSGWPFGGGIYHSLVSRRLLVEGVRRVASLTLTVDGEECEPCCDVEIERDMLLESGDHQISVRYAEDAE